MTVISVTGDGDRIGEGGNHWLHAMRRNIDFTHILQDNQNYGLTKGQMSPTSPMGYIGGTTPEGSLEAQANPLTLAAGATFVSRALRATSSNWSRSCRRRFDTAGMRWWTSFSRA